MTEEHEEKNLEAGNSPTVKIAKAGTPDLIVDFGEAGLDKLLKDIQGNTIGQLPVVKTVYTLVKAAFAIKDYLFQKKLFRFIAGFKDADEFLKEKIEQALPDQQDKQEMGEHLVLALQRFDQMTKADALCKLFIARISSAITHKEFLQYTVALDRMDINDLDTLRAFYDSGSVIKDHNDVLRSFAFIKLVSVDYSGRPESGQLYPRSGGGGERFIKNRFGEKFVEALRAL